MMDKEKNEQIITGVFDPDAIVKTIFEGDTYQVTFNEISYEFSKVKDGNILISHDGVIKEQIKAESGDTDDGYVYDPMQTALTDEQMVHLINALNKHRKGGTQEKGSPAADKLVDNTSQDLGDAIKTNDEDYKGADKD